MRTRWSRRSIRYLAGSVLASFAALVLAHGYLARAAQASGMAGPSIDQVVAERSVVRGQALTAGALRIERIPTAYAQPGSFSKIAQVVGRVALVDISQGEAVTATRLARVRAGPVSSLIPEGLRAFAVPTSLPTGTVTAGDHVDVLATFASGQPHTETVVSGIEILFVLQGGGSGGSAAAGGTAGSPGGPLGGIGGPGLDAGAAGAGGQVTLILLVSPDQESRLAYARAFADLSVAIAPGGADATR